MKCRNTDLSMRVWLKETAHTKKLQTSISSCTRDFPGISYIFFLFLVEWIVLQEFLFTGRTVGVFLSLTMIGEHFSLLKELERVSIENSFEVSSSWA